MAKKTKPKPRPKPKPRYMVGTHALLAPSLDEAKRAA